MNINELIQRGIEVTIKPDAAGARTDLEHQSANGKKHHASGKASTAERSVDNAVKDARAREWLP